LFKKNSEYNLKHCLVIDTEKYLFICQRYIELNPVRAGMVNKPVDYRWSSIHSNAFAKKATLWVPHPTYNLLGKSHIERAMRYRAMFERQIEAKALLQIRQTLNQGMVLGDNRFIKQIQMLSGVRTQLMKRGPRAK